MHGGPYSLPEAQEEVTREPRRHLSQTAGLRLSGVMPTEEVKPVVSMITTVEEPAAPGTGAAKRARQFVPAQTPTTRRSRTKRAAAQAPSQGQTSQGRVSEDQPFFTPLRERVGGDQPLEEERPYLFRHSSAKAENAGKLREWEQRELSLQEKPRPAGV